MSPDSKVMLILYFLTALSIHVTCLQTINGGYEILDLQSASSDIGFEAANWSVYPRVLSQGSSYTKCDTTFLLGGYNVLTNFGYFSRTYTGLPAHNSVSILVTFWLLDLWVPQDYISVSISNQVQTFLVSNIIQVTSNQISWTSECGDSNTRDIPSIQTLIVAPHTGSTLNILFTNYVSSSTSNRGFSGIRDLQVTLFQQTTTSSICSIAPDYTLSTGYSCTCPAQKYKNPTTLQCEPCDGSCGSCSGPNPTDCLYCNDNYIFDGSRCRQCDLTCATCSGLSSTQCLSCPANKYLQTDFSCSSSCNSPNTAVSRNGILYCQLPCLPPNFIYSDGTCSASCVAPFSQVIAGSVLNCNFPCKPDFFLDSDGTCKQSCLAPYLIRIQGNYRFCDYPCQSSQYLMPDGTCASSSTSTSGSNPCGSLLISRTTSSGNNYCDTPCTSSQYTFENRLCLDKCESPLVVVLLNGKALCEQPPGTTGEYYDVGTGTWVSSCPSKTTLQQGELYDQCVQTSSSPITLGSVSSFTGKIVDASLIGVSVVSTGNPTGILLGVLAKMFYYIKYFETTYSAQLKEALHIWNGNFLPVQVDFTAPNTLIDANSNTIPTVFSQWGIYPSFIANFWNDFIVFLIGLGIVIGFAALSRLAIRYRGKRYSYFILRKLKLISINLLLTYIYNSFDSIVFYTVLEIRSSTFNSGLAWLSVAMTAVFLIAASFMLGFHILILRRLRLLQRKPKGNAKTVELTRFTRKYENFKILFEDFKNESFSQEACLLLSAFRDIILNLVLTLLYNHPFIEIIIVMIINILMLLYLVHQRPIKGLLSLIYQIVAEFLLFTVNCCVMIMVILDYRGALAMPMRENIGRYIISANILFNVFVVFYFGIRIYETLKELYKLRKMGIKKIFEMMIVSQLRPIYIAQAEGRAPATTTLSVFGKTEDKTSEGGETGEGTARSRRVSHNPQDLTFEISAPKNFQELTSKRADQYLNTISETRSIMFQADTYTERNYTMKVERNMTQEEYSVVDVSGFDKLPGKADEINQTVNEAIQMAPQVLTGQGGIVSSPFYRVDTDISLLSHK